MKKFITYLHQHHRVAVMTVLAMAACLTILACTATTSILGGGPKDAKQLTAANIDQQAEFQKRDVAVQIEKAAATNAAAAATSPDDKARVQALVDKAVQDAANLAADQKAWNDKLDAAQTDIAAQNSRNNTIVGGFLQAASQPPTSPLAWLAWGSALIGALGLGGVGDSVRKSSTIQTQAAQIATLQQATTPPAAGLPGNANVPPLATNSTP